MHGRILKTVSAVIAVLLLIAAVPGCGQSSPIKIIKEPEYADAIAESILQALNNGDYAAYSEHFNEAMKRAVPEAAFREKAAFIKEKIGNYKYKAFASARIEDIYTVVFYRAKFSDETWGVTVKIVFLETNDDVFVSDLWFDSPKLRAK